MHTSVLNHHTSSRYTAAAPTSCSQLSCRHRLRRYFGRGAERPYGWASPAWRAQVAVTLYDAYDQQIDYEEVCAMGGVTAQSFGV